MIQREKPEEFVHTNVRVYPPLLQCRDSECSGRQTLTGVGPTVLELADLQRYWPPLSSERGGYSVHPAVTGSPIDFLPLDIPSGPAALCITIDALGGYSCVGVVGVAGERFRTACAGDGLTLALIELARLGTWKRGRFAGVPGSAIQVHRLGAETALSTDQTHMSVIAGEVIIKWLNHPDLRGDQLLRLEQIRAAGFTAVPQNLAHVTWETPRGPRAVVLIDHYVEGAEDGWTWCLQAARDYAHDPTGSKEWTPEFIGRALGNLIADLHAAMAKPTALLPNPTANATDADVRTWAVDACGLFSRADQSFTGQLADRDTRRGWGILRDCLDVGIPRIPPVISLTHADLHIGQVLLTPSNDLLLVDFEGDPLAQERPVLDSPMRDVAHMATSLALVGQAAAKRDGESDWLWAWTRRACTQFVKGYRSAGEQLGLPAAFDQRLFHAFVAEQLAAELIYSHTVLPRWSYAPLGVVRSVDKTGLLAPHREPMS